MDSGNTRSAHYKAMHSHYPLRPHTSLLHRPCLSSLLGKKRQSWLETVGTSETMRPIWLLKEVTWLSVSVQGGLCRRPGGLQVPHGLGEPSFHSRDKGKGYSLLCSSPGHSPCRAELMPHVETAAGRTCRVRSAQSPSLPLLVSPCTALLMCTDPED